MSHLGIKKCSDMVSRRFLDATVNMLQKEIDGLKAELAKEKKVVDFYAEQENIKDYFSQDDFDSFGIKISYFFKAHQRQRERNEKN